MANKKELGQALSNLSTKEDRIELEGVLYAVKPENTDSFSLQVESSDYSVNNIGEMPEDWLQLLLDKETVQEVIDYLKSHTDIPGDDFVKLENVTAKTTINEAQKVMVGDMIFFNIDSGVLIEVTANSTESNDGNKGNDNRFTLTISENQMPTLLKALSKFMG